MRILTVSDLHTPFNHPQALDFLADLHRRTRPDVVVCIGDEIDAHGWSRHERLPDAPGQADELRSARGELAKLVKIIGRRKEVLVCESNHTMRHLKMGARVGLPSEFMRSIGDVLELPKTWRWAPRHVVDGILFIHGEGYSGQNCALTAALKNRCCTVIGHVHSSAGCQYHSNGMDTIWGMNVGCLVDPDSYGMQYARKGQNMQILSTGVIEGRQPRLELMR